VLFGNNSYLTKLDPTQPIVNKKFSTQPNPWVNPTHGHVWNHCSARAIPPND